MSSSRDGKADDADRRKDEPIVSRKAFIGTLSAIAFTTGLTIALIPAYKRNRLRASARQAGKALEGVSRRQTPVAGVGSAAVGPYAEKEEGMVRRLQSSPRAESPISSKMIARPGPLDGLLGPPPSSSGGGGNITSSSKDRQGLPSGIRPRKAGPLDGLLAGNDVPPGAAVTAQLGTMRGTGLRDLKAGTTSGGRGMGVLGGLTAVSTSTSTVVAGSPQIPNTPTTTSTSTTTTTTSTPPTEPLDPSATSTTTPSPEDLELEPVPPQITYFSLTPADPYSDEEDAHGFPLDEPTEGELAEGEEGEISPWFAAKAFGIATALVVGGAGVIMVGVGKGLGVRDMDEFTAKMRSWTQKTLPDLQEQIFKPLPSEPSDHSVRGADDDHLDDGRPRIGFIPVPPASPSAVIGTGARKRTREDEEEEEIVSGWWEGVVEGAEEERKGRGRGR